LGLLIDDSAGASFRRHSIAAGDGLRLAVRDYGDETSPVVLCLTGLTRNAKDYHSLASALCDHYRVIALDYRGRGKSEWDSNPANYDPRTNISDIGHVLTALDIEHCAVVGTSLGGLLGFAMGIAMPTRILGLMINDVAPIITEDAITSISGYLKAPPIHRSWDEVVADLQKCFPDMPAQDDDDWLIIAKATFRQRDDGMIVPDWDHQIGRIIGGPPPDPEQLWRMFDSLGKRPVALVRGARSRFVTPDIADAMIERRGTLPCVVIEGVGHTPSLMEPDARALIDAWLLDCFAEIKSPVR